SPDPFERQILGESYLPTPYRLRIDLCKLFGWRRNPARRQKITMEAVARTMCACPTAKITVPGSRSYRLRGCYLSWAPSEAQTGGLDYRGPTLPLPEGLIPALTEGPCLAPSEGSPRLHRDVVK